MELESPMGIVFIGKFFPLDCAHEGAQEEGRPLSGFGLFLIRMTIPLKVPQSNASRKFFYFLLIINICQ